MESLTQNQRSKNGTSRGVCEQYRVSLERRIAQGDIDLVCGDEELCQRVEGMLKEGDPRDALTVRDLDILAVMEDSLKAPPDWGRTVGGLKGPATVPGLGAISKAFEVLERAALNLYLCPWRKEYRVVKIFSGIFTHLLRPALSEQQVVHLFGLLGYQAKEAELELRGPPPSAATLLGLACAFFAARCESRLLSAAAAASSGGPGAELTLVQERRKGHSLQGALESLRKAGESSWGYRVQVDQDMDLYTADGEGLSGETEAESAGQKLSTAFEDREGASSLPAGASSNSVSASSLRVSITLKSQQSAARSLEPERQPAVSRTAGDGVMATEPEQNQTCICYCAPLYPLYYCQQCNHFHSVTCHISDSCRKNNHNLELISDTALSGPSEGGASAEPWKESSAGTALQAAWSKEGRASTALSEQLKVGEALETGLGRPKAGGASAAPVEQPGESRALSVERGMTCNRQDCTNLSYGYCSSCGFKICEQCWMHSQAKCACGKCLLRTFHMSSV
ncbi:spermatogenesis associated 2-like isoform X2 [Anguilla rostrata]|uniref:spermatogenesis associated 2-like isoform X2 n=1 Tax=Anguilla rostrata TaxID=7938 RepID=UPI0030CFBA0F